MKKTENNGYRLKMLAGIVMKFARKDVENRIGTSEIHPLGLGVLRILSHHEHTLTEVGDHMMLAPATLLPVIDALEKQGFVKRNADPRDRRRTPLSLTAKGKNLMSKTPFVHPNDLLVQSLAKMGEQKTQQLIGLMEELAILMSKNPFIREKIDTIMEMEKPTKRKTK